jgi:mRNA-degrading endonuclease RelE of RelBE toxin-antitoxin system
MAYSVGVERRAQKQIARLSSEMQDRVEAALQVLYEIDDDQRAVTVLRVGHRRDVYRRG